MSDPIMSRDDVLRMLVKHNTMLSAYIYSLVEDWGIVEEALQETAVYVCNHWQDFQRGTSFAAWARTVAHMRSREALHRERREHKLRTAVAMEVPDEMWDRHGTHDTDRKRALTECLRRLSDKHRRILGMRYRTGRSCAGIADRLQQSIESVYMTLSRIRQLLRKCVEDRLKRSTV